MTNTTENPRLGAFTIDSSLLTSCKFCDGHIHTNEDFRICMQCGQEQITSEYWRLKMK